MICVSGVNLTPLISLHSLTHLSYIFHTHHLHTYSSTQVVLGEGDSDEVGSLFDDTQQQQQQQAITHKPLVVLVNKHSASASEILSGALHDNGRAMLIGDTPTFGKGRIQSVYELRDGSALFVTVAM